MSTFDIILISPENDLPEELSILISLMESGLQTYHLRKPGFSFNDMEVWLKNIPSRYHDRIMIHSHYELAENYSIKGIHLSEETKPKFPEFAFIREKGMKISGSFHSLEDIKHSGGKFDYVFISPVFDSISKSGYHSAFNPELLRAFLKNMSGIRTIALGGITDNNLSLVIKTGFQGAALLGTIWNSSSPVKAFSQCLSAVEISL